MRFDVPVAEATPLIEEARALLDSPAEDLIAEHGRKHGHRPNQDPDGSLAAHIREFKYSMHRLGADAELYAPNISKRLGGRGTSLRVRCTCKRRSFCGVSGGSSGSSPGPMARIL